MALADYQWSKLQVISFCTLSPFHKSHYQVNLGQAYGDFPVFSKIWDSRETVKSLIAWVISDIIMKTSLKVVL